MKNLLSYTVPGSEGPVEIIPPSGVPSGGLSGDGGKLFGFGITMLLIAAVILALGFLMYGGFNWIMSGGDKTKLESARHTIIYAIIGLIICFTSFFVISLFGSFFGIDLLKPTL